MPDDRDLGNRPIVDAMIALMDKLEAKERTAHAAARPLELAAEHLLEAGDRRRARALFLEAAAVYRAAGVCLYRAEDLEKRATKTTTRTRRGKR